MKINLKFFLVFSFLIISSVYESGSMERPPQNPFAGTPFSVSGSQQHPNVSRVRMTRGGQIASVEQHPFGAAFAQAPRKFEFSNQSDQYVTVWIPMSQGCWQPTLLYPYQDSGILNPIDRGTIYILVRRLGIS